MTALISQGITANTGKISSRPQKTRLFQERFVDPRSEGQKTPFLSYSNHDASFPQAPRLKNPFQPSSHDDASISQTPRLKNPFQPSTHDDASISQTPSLKNTTQPLIRARGRSPRRRRICGRHHKCACGLCPNQHICSTCGRQCTCIVCRPWLSGLIPIKFDSLAVTTGLIDARAAVIMPDWMVDLAEKGKVSALQLGPRPVAAGKRRHSRARRQGYAVRFPRDCDGDLVMRGV